LHAGLPTAGIQANGAFTHVQTARLDLEPAVRIAASGTGRFPLVDEVEVEPEPPIAQPVEEPEPEWVKLSPWVFLAGDCIAESDAAALARVHARVADEKRSNQPPDQPAATTDMACIRCGNQWQSKARATQVIKAPTGTAVIDRR